MRLRDQGAQEPETTINGALHRETPTVFDGLQEHLTSALVLGYVDYSFPFILDTDASHQRQGGD
jgi:hypothetical protein